MLFVRSCQWKHNNSLTTTCEVLFHVTFFGFFKKKQMSRTYKIYIFVQINCRTYIVKFYRMNSFFVLNSLVRRRIRNSVS